MHSTLIAAAAFAATALAESVGSAVVVNSCDYEVYLYNTPAADGGYSEIDEVLSAGGGTYEQTWTELSNGDGWSIKLSPNTSLTNIMQYEYTFQDDGIIWYDLSDVNGNPWNENWEITAESPSSTCDPKQQAYRYSTDDAYGMQACPQDSVITVTLCSGDSGDDSSASSASSSAAAESSTATSTWTTPTSTPASSVWAAATSTADLGEASTTAAASSASATTFSTATTSASSSTTTEADGATVTEVATAVVTDIVTATHWWSNPHGKRTAHGHAAYHNHA